MTLSNRLREYVAALFTGIYIQSHEHPDALREIAQLCRDEKWALATWDVDRGLQVAGHSAANTASDPVARAHPLDQRPGHARRVRRASCCPTSTVSSRAPKWCRRQLCQIQQGKTIRTFIVILSPHHAGADETGEALR